jgi:hypothetical protein
MVQQLGRAVPILPVRAGQGVIESRQHVSDRFDPVARHVRPESAISTQQDSLASVLREILGDRLFGSSSRRLCVPSFEGRHAEVYIFKTPHHPDFRLDWCEPMLKVALATSMQRRLRYSVPIARRSALVSSKTPAGSASSRREPGSAPVLRQASFGPANRPTTGNLA